MTHLEPASTAVIPVHPGTECWNVARLVVEKYEFPVPDPRQKIAFLWSHANGFHKEMLHPLMRRCLNQFRTMHEYEHAHIDFIAWDARNHGDSARLNHAHHTKSFTWFDHAMDTLQVVQSLKQNSYDMFIGVGHSFGATAMILCELMYPKTFHGLCLLEPVARNGILDYAMREKFPPIAVTLKRRDTWDSREACFKSLAGRPFWRDLHPEVLENYIKYGLYDTPDGKVRLKCPKEQEHLVYWVGPFAAATAFAGLSAISIPLHFVHANGSTFTEPSLAPSIVQQNPKWITSAMVEGSHMVPGEKNLDTLVPHVVSLTERVRRSLHQAKL